MPVSCHMRVGLAPKRASSSAAGRNAPRGARGLRASRQSSSLAGCSGGLRCAKLGFSGAAASSRSNSVVRMSLNLPPWEARGGMQEYLLKNKLVSMLPDGVEEAQEQGVPLLDVREPGDYDNVHAVGAVSVPLYRPISGFSPMKLMRRVVYATNGMAGTEANPDFVKEVEEKFPDKAAPILVICDSGGSYEATATSGLEGKKSRSLIACYLMMKQAGYENVLHVAGGLRDWCKVEKPVVGEDVESWKRKAASMP